MILDLDKAKRQYKQILNDELVEAYDINVIKKILASYFENRGFYKESYSLYNEVQNNVGGCETQLYRLNRFLNDSYKKI